MASNIIFTADKTEIGERESFSIRRTGWDTWDASLPWESLSDCIMTLSNAFSAPADSVTRGVVYQVRNVAGNYRPQSKLQWLDTDGQEYILSIHYDELPLLASALTDLAAEVGESLDLDYSKLTRIKPGNRFDHQLANAVKDTDTELSRAIGEIGEGAAPVQSVNGQEGDIVLGPDDVGAAPSSVVSQVTDLETLTDSGRLSETQLNATIGAGVNGGREYIFAGTPPVPLLPVSDAITDNAPRIQAMVDYAVTNGYSTVVIPPGSFPCLTGIDLPGGTSRITLAGGVSRRSVLDWSLAATGVTGVTVGSAANLANTYTPLRDIRLEGPGTRNLTMTAYDGKDSTGVDIYGYHMGLDRVSFAYWGVSTDIAHSNTYIITFNRCVWGFFENAVYIDMAARGATNSGERITFHDCTISSGTLGIRAVGNGITLFFNQGSIDFVRNGFSFQDCMFKFVGSHMEGKYATSGSGWYNDQRHFGGCDWYVRGAFIGCDFVLRDGMRRILSPGGNPHSATAASVVFQGCTGYAVRADNTTQYNSRSEELLNPSAATAFPLAIESPFVSNFSIPTVALRGYASGVTAPVVPYVQGYSTVSDTVSINAFDALTETQRWVLKFG